MKKLAKSLSVVLAAAMLMSLAGCDSFKTSNGKKDKDEEEELITEKAAITIAEDYSKALIDLDSDKVIELSSKISDSYAEMIQNYEFYEESKNVYEHWLTTFEYTIEKDEIDIDEDKATVPVTISYIDLNSVSTESNKESEWIEGIDECESKKDMAFDIELKYDDDDEKIYVTNSDDLIDVFYYDILNTYIYVNTYVFYDNAVTGNWSADSYKTTENLKFDISFSDIDELDGTDVLVTIEDPEYNDVYSETVTFDAGNTTTVTCKPSDAGVIEFDEGYYSISITNENSNFSFVASVKVNKPDLEPNKLDSDVILAPDESTFGTYDELTGIYTNEFFGFKYTVTEDLASLDPQTVKDLYASIDELKNFDIDLYLSSTAGDVVIIHMLAKINLEDETADPIDVFVANMSTQGVEAEPIMVGNIQFYKFTSNGADYFFTFKDNDLFMLGFYSSTDVSIDDLIVTFEELK